MYLIKQNECLCLHSTKIMNEPQFRVKLGDLILITSYCIAYLSSEVFPELHFGSAVRKKKNLMNRQPRFWIVSSKCKAAQCWFSIVLWYCKASFSLFVRPRCFVSPTTIPIAGCLNDRLPSNGPHLCADNVLKQLQGLYLFLPTQHARPTRVYWPSQLIKLMLP